jgi:hypothetical protein
MIKKKKPTKKKAAKKALRQSKSHYKSTIGSIKPKKLTTSEKRNLTVLAKAHQIIWKGLNIEVRNLKENDKIGRARVLLLQVIQANGFVLTESGKLIKALK